MEIAIEKFAAINFIVMGLSHVIRPAAWVQFFQLLHSKGEAGAFINGFITIGMGSLIVAFHNVWVGLPALLTLIGWSYVLKSLVIFTVPQLGLKSMARVTPENHKKFVFPGLFLIILGIVIGYGAIVR